VTAVDIMRKNSGDRAAHECRDFHVTQADYRYLYKSPVDNPLQMTKKIRDRQPKDVADDKI